jgi:hypothetical protein
MDAMRRITATHSVQFIHFVRVAVPADQAKRGNERDRVPSVSLHLVVRLAMACRADLP